MEKVITNKEMIQLSATHRLDKDSAELEAWSLYYMYLAIKGIYNNGDVLNEYTLQVGRLPLSHSSVERCSIEDLCNEICRKIKKHGYSSQCGHIPQDDNIGFIFNIVVMLNFWE